MDFDALMQQVMAGPDEAAKRRALATALAAGSFGILGSRTGGGVGGAMNALGQGGLLGMNVYNNEMANAAQAPLQQLKTASELMDFQGKKQAFDDTNAARSVLQNFKMPGPLPSMAPTPANAQALASAPKQGNYERLNAMADALEAKGLIQQAQTYRAMAEKYAPKYKDTQTVMKDGKPVLLQMYENQAPTEMGGYQPKPDYKQVDTGGQVGFYDPLTGMRGGNFDKTQSPDAKASNAVAWANYGLAKQRENREAANVGKPQWDSGSGQFVYPPSDNAPNGKAVSPQGFTRDTKPSDQQLMTQNYLDRMRDASKTIGTLEKGGYTPGLAGALMDTPGKIPLVGGIYGGLAHSATNMVYPERGQYMQAQDAWIIAKLRKESGAVIGKEEMDNERKTFFPQPGDSDAVIKQKANSRAAVERSMEQAAGGKRSQVAGMSDEALRKALGI